MKVELRHIHKHFGPVHANDDVSLTVEPGTIHGLLGENGAGKSTLVKILSGFITRDSGDIQLDGRLADIKTPSDAIGYGIGMLHQDPLDFPPLTVIENFMAGAPIRKQLSAQRRTPFFLKSNSAAKEFKALGSQFDFNLDPQAAVNDLTVGERQQLEILRLLSLGVRTLILDEPTTGISASQKTLLFSALKKLAGEGKSIIFVSHKLDDVEALCDCVTVMRLGQVIGELDLQPHRGEHGGQSGGQDGISKDGHALISSRIVEMMFGKELAPPIKPETRQDEIALQLDELMLIDERLSTRIENLIVQRGEVIGIAGLEGSGQQQFLLTCAGLMRAASGAVRVGNIDMTHQPYRSYLKAGVCYLPADRLRDGLINGLTIQDHVALRMPAPGAFVDRSATLQGAQRAIETFNIRGKPDTPVERLSGGNQQRTQLALMPSPLNVLLMEHPTRGLDIESTLWVWQQLIARCRQGTAILFASSDLDEIMQYSDRVIVFSGGKISAPFDALDLTVEKLGQMIGGKF
jgi:simple sugar transport system ATP-binding protein